jgi:hypothetical protein
LLAKAYDVAEELMDDKAQPGAVRLRAMEFVRDTVLSKPAQEVQHTHNFGAAHLRALKDVSAMPAGTVIEHEPR